MRLKKLAQIGTVDVHGICNFLGGKVTVIIILYHADTLNSYRLYFNQVTQDLISSVMPEEEQDTDLLTQIQQYIMQNYDDCNFSAQKIADAMSRHVQGREA